MYACQAFAILDSLCTRPFDVVVVSPLFIGIALSLLGRAAATEPFVPSCCWCVGQPPARLAPFLRGRASSADEQCLLWGWSSPQYLGYNRGGESLIVSSKCSGHRHIGIVDEFRRLNI